MFVDFYRLTRLNKYSKLWVKTASQMGMIMKE